MKNAKIKKSTYENVYVDCPCCKKENIYNRRSDLKDTNIFSGKLVKCFYCNQEYQIYDQLLQETYRYLLDCCQDFMEQKQYMYSIISLCIACESFMFYAIKQVLLYIPKNNNIISVEQFNELSIRLFEKIEKFTFKKMRDIFLNTFLHDRQFKSYTDILNYIDNIGNLKSKNQIVQDIENYPEERLKEYFIKFINLSINDTRNDVVHKIAYRPSLDQVIKHKEEVEDVITGLSVRLWEKYRWKRFFI